MLRNTTKWSSCLRNKKARAYPNKDALLTFYKHSGQWLWFGWKSICFPQQRSLVRIQSPAKFYIELNQTLNCCEKTKIKIKRVLNGPLKNSLKHARFLDWAWFGITPIREDYFNLKWKLMRLTEDILSRIEEHKV